MRAAYLCIKRNHIYKKPNTLLVQEHMSRVYMAAAISCSKHLAPAMH